jgi:6-phosphogluconolactonase (cycloisomerase 2 family)
MKALRNIHCLCLALPLALAACSYPSAGSSSLLPEATAGLPLVKSAGHAVGNYLYVENGNSTISAFALAKSGSLREISGSPFASDTTGPGQFDVAIDPQGAVLYTAGSESDNLAIFSIGSGGVITLVSDSSQIGSGAGFPLLTKGDQRLYVLDEVNGGQVAAFDLKNRGDELKTVPGSPFQISCPGFCDPNPSSAVISGSYLYTVDTYGWYVSTFSISKSGALKELDSYATGYGPTDAVMTSKGADLYVTDGAAKSISGYSVAGGVLTALNDSPFSAGDEPDGIAIAPNNKYVYVANSGDSTISGYSVGAGGNLKALAGSPFADGSAAGPNAVIVDSAGKHLFVANGSTEQIAVYAIAGSGALSQIKGSPFTENEGASGPQGLAIYE